MTHLPDDILYMVCTQLWHQQDVNTLFNCACSGKQLADMAVTFLYRKQCVVPLSARNKPLGGMNPKQRSCLWQTIILSSLGKTLYPYSQYIRTLDLRGLEQALVASGLGAETGSGFFQGELAQFRVAAMNGRSQFDVMAEAIHNIGEVITKQTPLVEELQGRVSSRVLSRWIPRLPRLAYLTSWHGRAIEDNGTLIRLHCPSFKKLGIRDWNGCDSDQGPAAFLNELRPNSLESFEMFSYHNVGPETFQALSCHGESLIDLTLHDVPSSHISKISLLKGCTSLVSLSLGEGRRYSADFEKPSHDAILETAAWLKGCKNLRHLFFARFSSAPALITPILLENSIHLTSLEYEGSVKGDTQENHQKFYQALAGKTSLQSLSLRGVVDYVLEADFVVQSLSKLANLKHLNVKDVSESFTDRHIVQLASSLPKLEWWLTGGHGLTDVIWGEVASLRSLRRLEIVASTRFMVDGILDFIENLAPGDNGLFVSVMNVDLDSDSHLSYDEDSLISERIAKQVDGKFEYTVRRDSESSSIEDEPSSDEDEDEDEDD